MAIGLLIGLVVLFLPASTAPPLRLSFLGYTNNAQGKLQAIFRMTNMSNRSFDIGVLPTEVRDGSGWKTTDERSELVTTTIPPGKNEVRTWAIFETNGVWRQPISYWRNDRERHQLSTFLRFIHVLKNHNHFGSTVWSDPITEPPPRPKPKA